MDFNNFVIGIPGIFYMSRSIALIAAAVLLIISGKYNCSMFLGPVNFNPLENAQIGRGGDHDLLNSF